MLIKKTSILLAIGLTFASMSAQEREKPVRFPPGQDRYFRLYAYTGSQYLHLGKDGTYRRINREHLFVVENDRGTWIQDAAGGITLVSPEHCRNIECGPLSMYMWRKENRTRIAPLIRKIKEFLARHAEGSFSAEQVENLERYGQENILSRIDVDDGVNRVLRSDLEGLLRCIQAFQEDPDKNRFHATPFSYRGFTFLVWKDSETPINRDPAEIRQAIDALAPGETPAYFFTMIDAETFLKESSTTQEFLYHPELNKKDTKK